MVVSPAPVTNPLARLAVFAPWSRDWVLYEDADVVVLDKPAVVATHAPDEGAGVPPAGDGVTRLREWMARRDGVAPERVYLGIHQRLDRETSGVLLLSRSRTANPGLAREFENRRAKKIYVAAVTRGRGPREGTLRHDLVPAGDGKMQALAPGSGRRGAVEAITHFRELSRHGDRALLELTPETGRTHQLRVQCAAAGMPIVGDSRYGGVPALRLMLHARSLTLQHPGFGRRMTWEAMVPPEVIASAEGLDTTRRMADALAAAGVARWGLANDTQTTAFRLADAGDGLRDAAVDVYGTHALVHFMAGAVDEALLDAVAALGLTGVYAKLRPRQSNTLVDTRREDLAPAHALRGADADTEFTVCEHGLRYIVRLGDGMSTGIFLDQRANRLRLREISAGRSVLNLFAYTGPFTVAAAAGGASRTVSVDASQGALAWARRNLVANHLDGPDNSLVTSDVFAWLAGARARGDRYDVVVVDPPSYSTTRDGRFSAASDYRALMAAVYPVVAPGGRVLACCNHRGIPRMRFRRYLHEAARDAVRTVTQLRDLPPPIDFSPAPGVESHLKSVLITLAD